MANPAVKMSADSAAAHKDMANAIRALAMDAVEKAKSGHPGMPMGMADVATVLFTRFLKFDASAPDWPDRDRFVLSAGHGSMLLYALLHLTGYPGMTMDELRNFRQLGSKTAGHPEFGHAPGIETTTGPLGQGLANAVGMALAERLLNARLGDAHRRSLHLCARRRRLPDGGHQPGGDLARRPPQAQQADRAVRRQLDLDRRADVARRLGRPDRSASRPRAGAPCGSTATIPRRSPLPSSGARRSDRPTLIACKTMIGYGAPTKQGKASTHGEPLGADEIKGAREKLGWAQRAFEVPADVLAAWRAAGARGADQRKAWEQRAAKLDASAKLARSDRRRRARKAIAAAVAEIKAEFAAAPPKIATRVASQKVLEKLVPALPCLIGGSADLTGSNGTRTKQHVAVAPGSFAGNYIHYGVREHAMAAAMNGLALHGGIVPYGGTFLVFTDYCRPAIRLSALMGQRVVYVMTHDSIGLGEDGPTHQPVEHLASLRAMPNLNVFRPADAVETAECWELALAVAAHAVDPGADAAGRAGAAHGGGGENLCAKGAYVLAEATGGKRDVTILATGSEVGLAMEARELLAKDGVQAAVVSMPCWELFAAQPVAYRNAVLGTAPRVAVEAAVGFGWERWLGEGGIFVGMEGFGASAPAPKLYEHFGITPAKVAEAARKLVG